MIGRHQEYQLPKFADFHESDPKLPAKKNNNIFFTFNRNWTGLFLRCEDWGGGAIRPPLHKYRMHGPSKMKLEREVKIKSAKQKCFHMGPLGSLQGVPTSCRM
jgi:hypothetical protein